MWPVHWRSVSLPCTKCEIALRETKWGCSREKQALKMVATSAMKIKSPECVSKLVESSGHSPVTSDFNYWDSVASEPNLQDTALEAKGSCNRLAKLLETSLSKSKQAELHCFKVQLPNKLARRIAEDVLRLSASEPCGLRGCVMPVVLEAENLCKKLDSIIFDPRVAPTFELILFLKQDGGAWPKLRDFVLKRTHFLFGFRRIVKLAPGFRLLKRKLYSSSVGTIVEESSYV
ncbi:DNA damage-inducible transcript 4-like protein [Ambystoma mexicanum]|uniref:DNA damage-inducible transcript 4-like protein n=1 Tax=Ambystoma mexicanum TaxID=8296 RepID=UPI0037E98C70